MPLFTTTTIIFCCGGLVSSFAAVIGRDPARFRLVAADFVPARCARVAGSAGRAIDATTTRSPDRLALYRGLFSNGPTA